MHVVNDGLFVGIYPLLPLVAAGYGWRGGFVALGAIGALFALVYLLVVPEPERLKPVTRADGVVEAAPGWGIARPGLFAVLTFVGVLDSMARGTALTFAPFL